MDAVLMDSLDLVQYCLQSGCDSSIKGQAR